MSVLRSLRGRYFQPKAGMFRESHGIFAQLEPVDLELYRSLLSEPFSMPEHPLVMVFVVSYTRVVPWPMTPYLEASVGLRSRYGDEEGWQVKTMPVTKKVAMDGGRNIGFPKYIADEIRLVQSGDGWTGEERHEGSRRLVLEFTPGISRPLEPWEQEALGRPPFSDVVCHLLLPPDEGPTVCRVYLDQRVEPHNTPELGMVRVTVDASLPWAGLVSPETEVPGMFNRFTGGINLRAKPEGA